MKKVLLSLVLCCITMATMAQKDVTKFLGIPVDGNKSEMVRQLKSKGFTEHPYNNEVLTGEFNGRDVHVFIATNNDKVCRITVCDANTMDETSIRIRFNVLCEQFKNNSKYLSFSGEDLKLKEDEDISYEMTVHNKRYEAVFYQVPDTTAANYYEEFESLVYSKYTKEQLENPTYVINNDINVMFARYNLEKATKKPVWFMISEYYGEYYITMFYDNEYNRANGEDL